MYSTHPPQALAVSGFGGELLNVWDYGGDGPPLLLLHCTGTHGRVWDPVAHRLSSRFRVLAPDARGHGDSAKPQDRDAYRWEWSGRDVLAVVDALALGPDRLAVGHSGGGAQVAYAEMLRPGVFPRVALIDAIIAPSVAFSGESYLAKTARQRRTHFESRAEARDRFASKLPMRAWHPDALEAYVEYGLADDPSGGVNLKCPSHVEAWIYELGGASDVFERLEELQFDALLLTGGRSNIKPFVELQHARLPHSTFHCMEEAGHFIPQELPETLAAVLADWLTRSA